MKLEVGTGRSQKHGLQPRDLPTLRPGINFLTLNLLPHIKKQKLKFFPPEVEMKIHKTTHVSLSWLINTHVTNTSAQCLESYHFYINPLFIGLTFITSRAKNTEWLAVGFYIKKSIFRYILGDLMEELPKVLCSVGSTPLPWRAYLHDLNALFADSTHVWLCSPVFFLSFPSW